jgi:hypothetical protein
MPELTKHFIKLIILKKRGYIFIWPLFILIASIKFVLWNLK